MIIARPLSIEFDRALYRVTSKRGNAREPIFITDKNRVLFLDKKESDSIARIKTPLWLYKHYVLLGRNNGTKIRG